ncbi:dienelactone hydrolase family protein [Ancylobacter sp. 6x-1]|uniref:Dienelactone hydrolase family protein n=1 Tax=Ancylobacter crimeensis TaxID=2579147 RepID=A0ABT0DDY4_9HYPH|nr:dienelactone hydrolase family protein [Ancylobacter crimeensis]MCK0198079.1 dienelactone hydrolase family protein [Ancylobacter crimeensis]
MLDGPRLPPRSGGAPDSLVILLHGYGADGRDLIELGEIWAPLLPGTAFVSPHAPEPCAMAPVGRQWFGYVERNDRERWAGVEAAHPALDAFIAAELARYGLPASRLALVGFSQGTMMALHTGLRRAQPLAGIVGFSGIHVQPSSREDDTARARVASRPPVLLVHGDQDPVIPVSALTRARVTLAGAGITPETHIARGLGHGIDADGLDLAGRFLARVLKPQACA